MKKHNFKKCGWFCGECHDHVNYPETTGNLIRFMEERGMDTLSVCQGWLTDKESSRAHDGEKLREFIENASTEHVKLYLGAEFPKTRFGHTCWWKFPGLSDPLASYDSMHDISYFDVAGISDVKFTSPADDIPFTDEPPILKVQRWKKKGGVNMVPHPTSWWKTNKNASFICTNIAVDFCFDLLGERLYDTLAVMGYDAEQIFYQSFWFHLLNEGYRIAGVAETDGNIDDSPGHKIGDFRTYAFTGKKEFDRERFLDAICNGHSFVTSGPILEVTADNTHLPGSIIINDGKTHTLQVEAWFDSGVDDDFISWIVLYRNGKVAELIDIEKQKQTHIQHEFKIKPENERAWYIVKVYGKNRPEKKEYADIMQYAKLCEKERHTEYQQITSTAFTNPFYFQPSDYNEPKTVKPPFSGKITDESTGKPIIGAKIAVSRQGKLVDSCISDESGKFSFSAISLTAEIEISKAGYEKIHTSLFLHYEPLKKYFEYIYSGGWTIENSTLQPGQVSWDVFNFKELQQILNSIKWDFYLKK